MLPHGERPVDDTDGEGLASAGDHMAHMRLCTSAIQSRPLLSEHKIFVLVKEME